MNDLEKWITSDQFQEDMKRVDVIGFKLRRIRYAYYYGAGTKIMKELVDQYIKEVSNEQEK